MLVELTTDLVGKRSFWPAGSQIDLPQKEAVRRIKAGQAVPVRSQPVETTSGQRGRGRPRKAETGA